MFAKGLEQISAGRMEDAEKTFLMVLRSEPKADDALLNLGFIKFKKGEYSAALDYFKAVSSNPKTLLQKLNGQGLSLMYLSRLDESQEFLLNALEIDPDNYTTLSNLCAHAGFSKSESDSLRYASKAITLKPLDPGAYINLGSALQYCGRPLDAESAFLIAMDLDPHNPGVLLNLGVIAAQRGDEICALSYYDRVLSIDSPLNNKIAEAKFYKSLSLLRMGRLKEAWPLYDAGFSPTLALGRSPRRSFKVPLWDGRELSDGETLLCWKEQGIGDELFFLSCLPSVQTLAKNIIVECDKRLVTILSRSFPTVQIRESIYYNDSLGSALKTDYDYHIPVGSAFGLMRPSVEAFEVSRPILTAHPDKVERFKARIKPKCGRLKVGISWRSGNLSSLRNENYTSLSDWRPILELRQDIDFYSLQYGDPTSELRSAQSTFGVRINSWPDVDYKDDIDSLLAIIENLDLVITVGTAVSMLSASIGKRTWLLTKPSWDLFGTRRFLAYPSVEVFLAEGSEPVRGLIPGVAQSLSLEKA